MKNLLKIPVFMFLVVISGFLLSGCTISEEKIKEYNQIISQADILIEAKEYNNALKELNKASGLIPSRVEAFERIVEVFIIKNRLEDATTILDESGIKLSDTDRGPLYVSIGEAHYSLGEYDRALYNYQLAKGISDPNNEASLGMAKSYIQKGSIEKGKDLLQKKYEGDLYIESQYLLSFVYSLSDIEESKKILNEVEPGEQWREKYTRWNEVLESLTEDELFNSAKLAKHYLDIKYPYFAIALLEPQKEKMKEYVDGIYLLGKAYYEHGEYQKSIDLLENNTTLSDLNQHIYWILGRDYYLLDNIDSSFSYYDSAISYGADKAEEELYMEYVDLLLESNQTEKALVTMRKAERIYEKDWVRLYYMKLYVLRKENDKFEYHMNKVVYDTLEQELRSEFLYSKARYLIQTSQLDEASRVLGVYWELDQYDPRYNYLFAQLNFQKGDLEEARIYCKKAVEYDTERIITDEALKLLAQID